MSSDLIDHPLPRRFAQAPSAHLVEGVGSSAPVGEEQTETDCLEDAGDNTDSNEVKRSLFADDLGDDLDVMSVRVECD
jgi:hypothetical protein